MDQKLWWLWDREAQNQFQIFCCPVKFNLGDYFTKHHPPLHHVNMRKEFLTPQRYIEDLRRRGENGKRAAELAQAIAYCSGPAMRVC